MIKTLKCSDTKRLYDRQRVARFASIAEVARRKLVMLNNVCNREDLRVPTGNHLEELKGDLIGKNNIRINDQYRICFVWSEGNVYDVEIVDYH